MRNYRLDDMINGWFVGDFSPSALRSADAEVAVKTYPSGSHESPHTHKVATEVTLVLTGEARINGALLRAGDIVVLEPGEAAEFEAITEVTTVVVKTPSVAGDKFEC